MEEMEVEDPQPDEKISDAICSKNSMEVGKDAITDSESEDNIPNEGIEDFNSDSEDDNDDEDVAEEAEIKILEATLKENPYDYACHVTIIGKLQKLGELDRLRAARENMSATYPLSSDLWLSWIKDEINLATNEAHRNHIISLCERAVEDYLCEFLYIITLFLLQIYINQNHISSSVKSWYYSPIHTPKNNLIVPDKY